LRTQAVAREELAEILAFLEGRRLFAIVPDERVAVSVSWAPITPWPILAISAGGPPSTMDVSESG